MVPKLEAISNSKSSTQGADQGPVDEERQASAGDESQTTAAAQTTRARTIGLATASLSITQRRALFKGKTLPGSGQPGIPFFDDDDESEQTECDVEKRVDTTEDEQTCKRPRKSEPDCSIIKDEGDETDEVEETMASAVRDVAEDEVDSAHVSTALDDNEVTNDRPTSQPNMKEKASTHESEMASETSISTSTESSVL